MDEFEDDQEQNEDVDISQKLEAAEKARKALERQLSKAQEELGQVREQRIASALEGVPDLAANLWKQANPGREPTEDEVAALRGLGVQAPPPEEEPQAPTATTTYEPVAGGAAPGTVKQQDWGEFLGRLNDPTTRDQALKDFDEGRIQRTR